MPHTQKWMWRSGEEDLVIITLSENNEVFWACGKWPCGRWSYKWGPEAGGFYILEFSTRHHKCWRKHILQQTCDNTAVLLPDDHPAYDATELTEWYPTSKMHTNGNNEVMMLKVPQPPEWFGKGAFRQACCS